MSEAITLHIEKLQIQAIIGILDHERHTPQPLEINATITYHYTHTFLDYVELCHHITSCLQSKGYGLLEVALLDIASTLKQQHSNIQSLTLHIKKPAIVESCVVGASITRDFTRF